MSLKPRLRGNVYHARGTVPWREPNGEITTRRIERSTRAGSYKEAKKACKALERQYWERAYSSTGTAKTFAEAALTYMQTTGNDRYVDALLRHFGVTKLSNIDQDAANQAASILYPDCKPSTLNRQVYTPLLAIMNMAARRGRGLRPEIERPKGHRDRPPIEIPPDEWFDKVLPRCSPKLGALLMFWTLCGRRTGEAITMKPSQIDVLRKEATIGHTKNGEPIVVPLPDTFMDWLASIPNWRQQERVFGYKYSSGVYKALRTACKKAKVPYYPPKSAGRHSFASRLLRLGYSLKFVKEAGGWKTIKMPAEIYGHLEQSEVHNEMRQVGHAWGSQRPQQKRVKGVK